MSRPTELFIVAILVCASFSPAASTDTRYFREDHGVGAMYIALKSDATYDVTAREHMGVWVEESGTWTKTGAKITFSPKKSGAVPYTVEEVNYKGRTFLTIEGEGGPSIPISTRETKDA